jgi:hypothetical protein
MKVTFFDAKGVTFNILLGILHTWMKEEFENEHRWREIDIDLCKGSFDQIGGTQRFAEMCEGPVDDLRQNLSHKEVVWWTPYGGSWTISFGAADWIRYDFKGQRLGMWNSDFMRPISTMLKDMEDTLQVLDYQSSQPHWKWHETKYTTKKNPIDRQYDTGLLTCGIQWYNDFYEEKYEDEQEPQEEPDEYFCELAKKAGYSNWL